MSLLHAIRSFKKCSDKKQRVGKVRGNTKVQYQFPRNSNMAIDTKNGTYLNPGKELKMKYEKEARFMTGMGLKLDKDGKICLDDKQRPLGYRLPILEYTEQKIVSQKEKVDSDMWPGRSLAPFCITVALTAAIVGLSLAIASSLQ